MTQGRYAASYDEVGHKHKKSKKRYYQTCYFKDKEEIVWKLSETPYKKIPAFALNSRRA